MALELLLSQHNPDVLSCLANLSSDEVFTPPSVVNQMLDMLPQELFCNPDTTFLDPGTKSGVFLREIAKRLIAGLENQIPDLDERVDHIFKKQLFGIATTQLTSLLARRSLYCSKYPNSNFSVVKFDDPEGNIRFKRIAHRWQDGKCVYCGANRSEYDRDDDLENYSYEFIHTNALERIFNMRFDVIISNPPYQLSTGQGQSQASPLYHNFILQAMKLNPRYISMIIPSRWFSGGMGLDAFRAQILSDERMSKIVDYSLSTDCFPGVDIAGGVNYFLWDREHKGDCEYTYIDNGESITLQRKLNEYDVFVRNNSAIELVRKVKRFNEESISSIMSSLGPFGLGTSERGVAVDYGNSYELRSSAGNSYISKSKVNSGSQYIDKWKVIIGKATSAGAATANKKDGMRKVIATLDILRPNSVCTFSYFIGGAFDDYQMAVNCRDYYATRFVRFLLLQCLSSINISKDKFLFVPLQDFSEKWDDEKIYKKYKLTKKEIELIESTIKPFETNGGVEE